MLFMVVVDNLFVVFFVILLAQLRESGYSCHHETSRIDCHEYWDDAVTFWSTLTPLKFSTQEKTQTISVNSEHKHSEIEHFLVLNELLAGCSTTPPVYFGFESMPFRSTAMGRWCLVVYLQNQHKQIEKCNKLTVH